MPQFLSPDVTVQEVQGKAGTVPAASTSAFALAGYSPRGPEDKATLCTNFPEFVRNFGSFSKKSMNAYAVAAYFLNGGNKVWFVRKLHSDAVLATGSLDTFNVGASGRGIWANDAEVTLAGDPSFYDPLTATYSKFSLKTEIVDSQTGLLVASEVYDRLVLDDTEDPSYILNVVESSNDIVMSVSGVGGIPNALKPTIFTNVSLGVGDGSATIFNGTLTQVPLAEGLLTASVSGVPAAIDLGDGTFGPVIGGPSVSGTIDYTTGNVHLFISPAPALSAAVTLSGKKKPDASITAVLSGGVDGGLVSANDVVSVALKATKQGLYALDDVEEQMSLALPDYCGDSATDLALLTYAESRQDILVILTTPQGVNPQAAVNYRRLTLKTQSSYGAMYYPWVKVADPLNNNRPKLVPVVGHVAGRMAFTDVNENVGKAPAGVFRGQLRFIVGVERVLSKTERDQLYPAQINPIRSDASVGTAIWGNKTLQIVGDYTDVNIRRTFINLAKEQYQGLLDIVFEDIGAATFSIITTRLSLYLEGKFLANVIGSGVPSKEQAFKVICDETNNPEAVQIAKKIVIDEFVKPNIAAEFIHLKLQRVFDASQS